MSAVGHAGGKPTKWQRSSRKVMRARIRKAIVVGFVTICNGLTLFAFGATADRPWVVVFVALPAALATLGLRSSSIPDASLPGTGAVTVAVLTLLFQLLSFAFFAWLLFWLVDGLLSLVNVIGGFHVNSESIAFWIAFAVVLMIFTAFAIPAARNLVTGLYPAAGLHSPYAGFFRSQGSVLWTRAGGIAVVVTIVLVLTVYTDIPGHDWGTALFLSLLVLSSLVWSPRLVAAGRRDPKVTEEGLATAFRECGWTVVPSPQTGRAAIDPLLCDVDLFAYKDSQSILVQLNQDASASKTALAGATSVLTAARSLPRTELPPGVELPDAVVVLVDVGANPALDKFADLEALSIVKLDMKEHAASVIGAGRLDHELKAVAHLMVGEDASPPPDEVQAGVPA
jgi:hypothetical protein